MSLQALALQGALSEALPEEVLRLVSSSMASIPSNWEYHFLVLLLFHEYFLEAVTEIEEVGLLAQFALQEVGLHLEFIEGHAQFPLGLTAGAEGRLGSILSNERIILLDQGGWPLSHLGLGPEAHYGVAHLGDSSAGGLDGDRIIQHFSLLSGINVVHEFGIVVVVFPWLHLRLVHCN